jgi:hypothetical protein
MITVLAIETVGNGLEEKKKKEKQTPLTSILPVQ